MKIYKYNNYEHYVKAQEAANVRKINKVWVSNRTIMRICDFYDKSNPNSIAPSVLCHGTRNGAEQKMFLNEYPNSLILGTEISKTADDFDMTVRWDFQNRNEDWISKFDIIYSNSLDHCINPKSTLRVWSEQLNTNGIIFIEFAFGSDNSSRESDPFETSEEELLLLFNEVGLVLLDKLVVNNNMNQTLNPLFCLSKQLEDINN
jgi:hypothetical protein